MELKNISSFKNFRKINEEVDFGGHDFSNSTGFSKSLVGRGIFSLFRYLKKGINTFRMEFFKRELENEYFAAVLRFCEKYQVDLKTGIPGLALDDAEDVGEQQGENEDEQQPDYQCEIVAAQHPIVLQLQKPLPQFTKDDSIVALDKVSDEIDNGNMDIDVTKPSEALRKINKILNDPTLVSKLPPGGQGILTKIKTSLESKGVHENVYNSFEDALFDVYGITDYDDDELIEEKIGSMFNRTISIKKVLGDALPGGSKFGKFRMSDINWEGLANYCKNCKNDAARKIIARLVNKDAVKQIQYGISRIIYHTHRTPSFLGVNPGEGGGVMKQSYGGDTKMDTGLKNRWDKIVSNILSQFSAVMITDSEVKQEVVNPYKIISMEEAYRGASTSGVGEKLDDKLNADAFTSIFKGNTGKLFLTPGSDVTEGQFGLILLKHKTNSYLAYGFQASVLSGSTSGVTGRFNYLYPLNTDKLCQDLRLGNPIQQPILDNYKTTGDTIFGSVDDNNAYTQVLPLTDTLKIGFPYKKLQYFFKNLYNNPSIPTDVRKIQQSSYNGTEFRYGGNIMGTNSPVNGTVDIQILKIYLISNANAQKWNFPHRVSGSLFTRFNDKLKEQYKNFTFR